MVTNGRKVFSLLVLQQDDLSQCVILSVLMASQLGNRDRDPREERSAPNRGQNVEPNVQRAIPHGRLVFRLARSETHLEQTAGRSMG